jgi:alkanesulfonate monooxygenase SsuD/methylene tetrahydromethanopterin reductase-like flavin-dependent oxidoreductase (luciferase family)
VGNDALTPLGYLAAITNRMSLGTHIATLTARPPTVLAQAIQTIDAMAGGNRVIVGVGGGFPSSCEGWHGKPWGNPIRRMRDYVDVLRQVFHTAGPRDAEGNPIETTELFSERARARLADPVRCQSPEISIPYAGDGALAVQPWVSALESGLADPPIVLAAVGPRMISLTAEIADGWFPWGFAPGMMQAYEPLLAAGFERAGARQRREEFDIWAIVDLVVSDDVGAGIDLFRPYVVEWAEQMRFQTEALGFTDLCDRLAELVAAGRRGEALASVPDEYVDHAFLIGSRARIARRLKPWLESGATGLIFRYGPQVQVGTHAELVEDLDVWETIADAAHRVG